MRNNSRKHVRLDRSGTVLYDMALAACVRLYPNYFDVCEHRDIMAVIVRAMRNKLRELANPHAVPLGRKIPRPQTNTLGESRYGNR